MTPAVSIPPNEHNAPNINNRYNINNMDRLFNNQDESDVHFIIDGETIFAHRSVLEQKSNYFKNHLKEIPMAVNSNGISILHTNMTRAVLLSILKFFYTSILEIHVLCVPELMHYAEKFQMEELRKKGAQLVTDQVTFENVIDLFISADFYKVKGLKKACLQVIQTNFHLVSKTEGFSRLLKNSALISEISNVMPKDIEITQNTTQHLCHYTVSKQFQVGKRYTVFGIQGTIKYFGKTQFDSGKNLWIGLEADLPVGHHDGTVDSIRYFSSKPKHGLFVGFWFV